MRLMLLGTDRTLFAEGSAVHSRLVRLGSRLKALDSIVFSTRNHGITSAQKLSEQAHAHPTNSRSRLLYGWDAIRIARTLPRPDIISAQDPFETGLVAFCLARYLGVPLAVEVHTDFFAPAFRRHSILNKVRVLIARFVLCHADGGYAVSTRVAESINERYRLKVPMRVLPIFIDLARFRAITRMPQKNTLLWIGRFETEKNPSLAIESLARVRRAGIDARLIMLGKGSLEPELRKLAARLGIEDRVAFPGREDISAYLAIADAMLVTSAYEGYGMALVEALAAGVPVLSTDVGVAREAGAVIAEGEYADALVGTLQKPREAGILKLRQYANEEEYLKAVVDCYATIVRAAKQRS